MIIDCGKVRSNFFGGIVLKFFKCWLGVFDGFFLIWVSRLLFLCGVSREVEWEVEYVWVLGNDCKSLFWDFCWGWFGRWRLLERF